jgi:hypothetical protein
MPSSSLDMGVKKIMRESIMAQAVLVHKKQPRFFKCSNDPKGRSIPEMRQIEAVIQGQNAMMDARERAFYEDLYAKYKGDIADLPWNK